MEMIEMILDKVVYGLVVGGNDPHEVPDSVWDRLSEKPNLTVEFMLEFHEYLNWDKISMFHSDFTDNDCELIHDYLNWELVSKHRIIKPEILNKYFTAV